MAVDNSQLIATFAPTKDNGDIFTYTELLDRGERKGNNSSRLLRSFFHRSQEEFWEQWPYIKALCDALNIRAYSCLTQKSYAKVSDTHLRMCMEAHISKNHAGVKTLYNRAYRKTPPINKMWLFDVDVINDKTTEFGNRLVDNKHLIVSIPSRDGVHHVVKPFDVRIIERWFQELGLNTTAGVEEMSLHKDSPTNLYIPDGAE